MNDAPQPGSTARCLTRQEPLDAYLADRTHVSASRMRRVLRGEADAAKAIRPYTPEMVMGEAAHAFLLDPAEFERGFVAPVRGEPPAGVADPQALMQRVWLNEPQYAALEWARAAIERCAQAPLAAWLRVGLKELSIYWQDESGGRWKARPDCFGEDFVLEIKTVQDARARAFDRQRRRYGHDLQAAHYLDAVSQLTGRRPSRFLWITLELKPPCALYVHELAGGQVTQAMAQLCRVREEYSRTIAAPDVESVTAG